MPIGKKSKNELSIWTLDGRQKLGSNSKSKAEQKSTWLNLRMEMTTHMTALEEKSSHHMTMLQEIKGMLIRMQSKEEEEEEDD